jgi:predicted PurR-regulated permease PerM
MSGERAITGRLGLPLPVLATLLGVLGALWFLRTALAPFYLAVVLAYVMKPMADWLSHRMSRGAAALLAILVLTLVLGLLAWAFLPPLVAQVQRLVAALPTWLDKAAERWQPWFNAHPAIQAKLHQAVEGLDPKDFLMNLRVAGRSLLAWFLEMMTLILVPLILYHLQVEGPALTQWLRDLLPIRYREQADSLSYEINNRLGGYIRGQLAVMLVMAILHGLGLKLLGVPYCWMLGLLAGLCNLVPYSYYLTALPLALLFSVLEGAGGGHLLAVALVFVAIQKTEAFYFTPVWVGRASGLHPLEVLLGIFMFSFAFGLFGLVFAVPLMIVFKTVGRFWIARYMASPFYTRS